MSNLEQLERAMNPLKLTENIVKVESVLKKFYVDIYEYADSIRLLEERVSKLEQVSGKSMNELIVLFAAGWELRPPENSDVRISELLSEG